MELKFKAQRKSSEEWNYLDLGEYLTRDEKEQPDMLQYLHRNIRQFTGLISSKNEEAYLGDVISFQTTEGKEMVKELWYCNNKQSLMVGNFTYYELTQSGFIQPTKLEFDILPLT